MATFWPAAGAKFWGFSSFPLGFPFDLCTNVFLIAQNFGKIFLKLSTKKSRRHSRGRISDNNYNGSLARVVLLFGLFTIHTVRVVQITPWFSVYIGPRNRRGRRSSQIPLSQIPSGPGIWQIPLISKISRASGAKIPYRKGICDLRFLWFEIDGGGDAEPSCDLDHPNWWEDRVGGTWVDGRAGVGGSLC